MYVSGIFIWQIQDRVDLHRIKTKVISNRLATKKSRATVFSCQECTRWYKNPSYSVTVFLIKQLQTVRGTLVASESIFFDSIWTFFCNNLGTKKLHRNNWSNVVICSILCSNCNIITSQYLFHVNLVFGSRNCKNVRLPTAPCYEADDLVVCSNPFLYLITAHCI